MTPSACSGVLDDLRDQKARFTLAIIDACREPKGVSTWYWEIRANGTYAFWSTGPGAVAPHSGTLLAAEGKWALNSPSWVDGGTYQVPNANTLVANGRLGTGYWHRGP
jgi:hypothetical protein